MCAINGFNFNNRELILKMNKATGHRGPDGTGVFCDDQVSLGHNLLAITEIPQKSQQPVISKDGNYVLIYNGEIYNYQELAKDLERKGEVFTSRADTEVLFKGLLREGLDFIKKLDGMFALAFYDRPRKKIFLVRDPSGIKPLYFYYKDGRFIFSSEIRGLLVHNLNRRLDETITPIYFLLGYIPGYQTLIKDIHKIAPGQCLVFDLEKKTLKRQWLLTLPDEIITRQFRAEDLRERIKKAVINHTMGLRPFGLYLSGGLDSTAVLYELANSGINRLRTYTTRFAINDPRFNEDADTAGRLCQDFQIEHRELLITEEDFIKALPRAINAIEEPRYNPSVAAYWLLAQFASRDVTVILSGSGGDELFLGYPKYLTSKQISTRYQTYPRWLLNSYYWLSAGARLDQPLPRWARLNRIVDSFNRKGLRYLTNYLKPYEEISSKEKLVGDLENAVANLDRVIWLADEEFIRTDKITMNFGMEGRFPFLAREIINYAYSLPAAVKLKDGVSKYLMRAAYQNRLPDYVVDKRKSGWTAPVVYWMNSKLGEMVREVLSSSYYSPTSALFDFESIHKDHLNSPTFTTGRLKRFFPIFSFQLWANQFQIKL